MTDIELISKLMGKGFGNSLEDTAFQFINFLFSTSYGDEPVYYILSGKEPMVKTKHNNKSGELTLKDLGIDLTKPRVNLYTDFIDFSRINEETRLNECMLSLEESIVKLLARFMCGHLKNFEETVTIRMYGFVENYINCSKPEKRHLINLQIKEHYQIDGWVTAEEMEALYADILSSKAEFLSDRFPAKLHQQVIEELIDALKFPVKEKLASHINKAYISSARFDKLLFIVCLAHHLHFDYKFAIINTDDGIKLWICPIDRTLIVEIASIAHYALHHLELKKREPTNPPLKDLSGFGRPDLYISLPRDPDYRTDKRKHPSRLPNITKWIYDAAVTYQQFSAIADIYAHCQTAQQPAETQLPDSNITILFVKIMYSRHITHLMETVYSLIHKENLYNGSQGFWCPFTGIRVVLNLAIKEFCERKAQEIGLIALKQPNCIYDVLKINPEILKKVEFLHMLGDKELEGLFPKIVSNSKKGTDGKFSSEMALSFFGIFSLCLYLINAKFITVDTISSTMKTHILTIKESIGGNIKQWRSLFAKPFESLWIKRGLNHASIVFSKKTSIEAALADIFFLLQPRYVIYDAFLDFVRFVSRESLTDSNKALALKIAMAKESRPNRTERDAVYIFKPGHKVTAIAVAAVEAISIVSPPLTIVPGSCTPER